MKDKIFDLIQANKESEGPTLPVEKESIVEALGKIPQDIASEYSETISYHIEDLVVLKNIVSSSSSPNLVKYLIDGLNEYQIERLNVIVENMICFAGEVEVRKIVNATLGVSLPDEETKQKATELISFVKSFNFNHEEVSRDFAGIGRLLKTFCEIIFLCGMEDVNESRIIDRLSMIPKSDLDWLLDFGKKTLLD